MLYIYVLLPLLEKETSEIRKRSISLMDFLESVLTRRHALTTCTTYI